MEGAHPEEADAAEPEEEPALVAGFSRAEFTVAQAAEMPEQTAILESIQDEVYVESNWHFLRKEKAETDTL